MNNKRKRKKKRKKENEAEKNKNKNKNWPENSVGGLNIYFLCKSSYIYSLKKYLLSAFYMPGTVLKDGTVVKVRHTPCPQAMSWVVEDTGFHQRITQKYVTGTFNRGI
jgi:hypothetical protein